MKKVNINLSVLIRPKNEKVITKDQQEEIRLAKVK